MVRNGLHWMLVIVVFRYANKCARAFPTVQVAQRLQYYRYY